jgi:hypothetical protein
VVGRVGANESQVTPDLTPEAGEIDDRRSGNLSETDGVGPSNAEWPERPRQSEEERTLPIELNLLVEMLRNSGSQLERIKNILLDFVDPTPPNDGPGFSDRQSQPRQPRQKRRRTKIDLGLRVRLPPPLIFEI